MFLYIFIPMFPMLSSLLWIPNYFSLGSHSVVCNPTIFHLHGLHHLRLVNFNSPCHLHLSMSSSLTNNYFIFQKSNSLVKMIIYKNIDLILWRLQIFNNDDLLLDLMSIKKSQINRKVCHDFLSSS